MENIKKVMACVDLSDYSKMTIEYALAIVKGLDVEVLLLNVINSRDIEAAKIAIPYLPENLTIESYIEKARTKRIKAIKNLINDHFPNTGIKMVVLVRAGVPYQEILKTVEKEKVDVVVLGNKGKSNLVGTLHGSNGEKVFRHSPVPVLSVRDRKKFGRR
ncbi:universal stress protein [Desulforhopalus singaporensis]|uniref:Nucleotide-binding universal stress protein, UspA family n=1 Tax=Desulforhopalus singaporensis TaxID=91360 RepID=A0A1H0SUE4_9BACT|nr:universal stress protein [Desulforhopalus singaporensis]SDP44878.1 Nucleotide-binding universal stress protein, UspA family [Desulforhopalus singaporensis]